MFSPGGVFAPHADQSDLLEWMSHFENSGMRVYAIHGEQSVSAIFAKAVNERFGFESHAPLIGDTITVMPFKHKAVPEKPEEAVWRTHLDGIVRRAEEIRQLWRKSPQIVSGGLLQQLEDELAQTEQSLEAILKEMRNRDSADGR